MQNITSWRGYPIHINKGRNALSEYLAKILSARQKGGGGNKQQFGCCETCGKRLLNENPDGEDQVAEHGGTLTCSDNIAVS